MHKPIAAEIEEFISRQRNARFSYPDVGSTNGTLPPRYTVDRNRVQLGSGLQTFSQAVGRLRAWHMFKLGWVDLFPASAPIRVGQTVAVVVRHFGFWSMNACRIVYVIEEERQFSFAYGRCRITPSRVKSDFQLNGWRAMIRSGTAFLRFQGLASGKPESRSR
jgi:uncharacterized protein (UPF0548 family)